MAAAASSPDNEAVIAYVRARQALRETTERTQAERRESGEAKRALSAMLREAMERGNVSCVRLPGGAEGGDAYVCLRPPSRRAPKVRTEAEALLLVEGVAERVMVVTEAVATALEVEQPMQTTTA